MSATENKLFKPEVDASALEFEQRLKNDLKNFRSKRLNQNKVQLQSNRVKPFNLFFATNEEVVEETDIKNPFNATAKRASFAKNAKVLNLSVHYVIDTITNEVPMSHNLIADVFVSVFKSKNKPFMTIFTNEATHYTVGNKKDLILKQQLMLQMPNLSDAELHKFAQALDIELRRYSVRNKAELITGEQAMRIISEKLKRAADDKNEQFLKDKASKVVQARLSKKAAPTPAPLYNNE